MVGGTGRNDEGEEGLDGVLRMLGGQGVNSMKRQKVCVSGRSAELGRMR